MTGSDYPLVTGWAEARHIAVMPRLNCQNPSDENEILNQPGVRQHMIEQLADALLRTRLPGNPGRLRGRRSGRARTVHRIHHRARRERLHAQGDKLSTVVTAKYYNIMSGRAAMYNDAALSSPSDYMFVLDWGLHWTTSDARRDG